MSKSIKTGGFAMMPVRRRGIALWAVVGVLTTLLIVITPFLLQAAAPSNKDWEQLSNISQAYGALSVFFSAAALLGVVASLVHQSRQTAVTTEQALRASHQYVIALVMNDPTLLPGGEPPPINVTEQEARQMMLTNLFVSNWIAEYRLKRLNDGELRVVLSTHFRGEIPRKHWEGAGQHWRQLANASKVRREMRFVTIVDEMYREAVAQGPAIPSSSYFSGGT
ncbi:DUF6082 family protein [Streptomyces sp. NPDC091972]|uniref:DUF6082 family protein n=1 Tax=Streptomyces sp. NPDC091972 TaxID=3366007 RepID=UPI0038153E97